MHKSIATIDSPEFINLQPLDINPLMSSCEIKVLYLGENRNYTFISKEVATEMAKTLRGAPIVGYYKEEKEDFVDHGEKVIFDDEGMHFECMTVPYGFVAPDAKVWFQKFDDYDALGNTITREYLMTTGYLWTGQFEECKAAVENEGKPHSLEFQKETMQGEWSKNYKTDVEFFIINDAIFSKLCILGDDIEPCFEGSSIKAPEVSAKFTKVDSDFRKTLYTMMQDLQSALEGGQKMVLENQEVEPTVELENSEIQDKNDLENNSENQIHTEEETSAIKEEPVIEAQPEDAATATEFACKEDDKDKSKCAKEKDSEDEKKKESGSEDDNSNKEDEDEDKDEKYELLQQEYTELNTKYTTMQKEYEELKAFKNSIEDKEKDNLINRFYMLTDEDKKDIIENKTNYSLDDIEAKLSIIYTKKKLALEAEQKNVTDNAEVLTYNLAENASSLPDWIKAVREVEENLKF